MEALLQFARNVLNWSFDCSLRKHSLFFPYVVLLRVTKACNTF